MVECVEVEQGKGWVRKGVGEEVGDNRADDKNLRKGYERSLGEEIG